MEQGRIVTFQISTERKPRNGIEVTFTAPKGQEHDSRLLEALGLAGQALCRFCPYSQPNEGCNTLKPLNAQISPDGAKVFGVIGCGFLDPAQAQCLSMRRIFFDLTQLQTTA